MCVGPELAAGVAASAVGNYMQQKENNSNVNRQYNARNAAAQAGVAQQDADAAKSGAVLNNTINQFQPGAQSDNLGSLITSRANTINSNTATPAGFVDPTINTNAPKALQSDLASKMAGATAYGTQQGDALAKIGATSSQMVGNNLALNNSNNDINRLTNFAQGDYKVNQAQQNSAANNARKPANPLWSLLSQAGNAGTMAAAGGGTFGDLINPGPVAGQANAQFLANAQNAASLPTPIYGG